MGNRHTRDNNTDVTSSNGPDTPRASNLPTTNPDTTVPMEIVGDVCTICLQDAQARGGVPLFSPGCCGKWFHQSCVDQMVLAGNSTCPNCRTTFPSIVVGTPAPPVFLGGHLRRTSSLRNPPPPPRQTIDFSTVEDLIDESSLRLSSEMERSDPSHAKVFVECVPELSEISIAEYSDFYVNISMKAVAENSTSARLPMDLVCILDNSGSMQYQKIDSVKEAITFVRSQLTGDDRLSLITFNSSAAVVHGLMKMNDERKGLSGDLLTAVQAEGGTDIYSGMACAARVLDSRKSRNPISCVFLLTDGQDSSHMTEKIALARQMKTNGYSLFVFGFGNDHDAEQLQNIAGAAEAPFTFIEADTMVVDAFGGALGGQQGVMGKDICLTIKAAETSTTSARADQSQVQMLKLFSGRYTNFTAPDGSSGNVKFANIFAGEQRDILVKLRVPTVSGPADVYSLLSASLSYTTVGGVEMQGTPAGSGSVGEALCVVRRVVGAANAQPDVKVDAQKNRVLVTTALETSLSLADRGDYSEAKKEIKKVRDIIRDSKSHIAKEGMCEALIEELDEAYAKVDNAREFLACGGKATMCELSSTLNAQRTMYRKSHRKSGFSYQTVSSASVQQRSGTFKTAMNATK